MLATVTDTPPTPATNGTQRAPSYAQSMSATDDVRTATLRVNQANQALAEAKKARDEVIWRAVTKEGVTPGELHRTLAVAAAEDKDAERPLSTSRIRQIAALEAAERRTST